MDSPRRLHPFFNEKAILFPVLLLAGIGIVMVYSASSSISIEEHNTLFYYMKRQSIFLGTGLLVMFTAASFPYKLYRSIAYIILIVAIAPARGRPDPCAQRQSRRGLPLDFPGRVHLSAGRVRKNWPSSFSWPIPCPKNRR